MSDIAVSGSSAHLDYEEFINENKNRLTTL